jgi:tyrosyl-tRNA synthetase
VMSIPDSAMPVYFRLVTRWPPAEISRMEADLQTGALHPRDAKMKLAFEVASSFYGDDEAEKAQKGFIQTFQRHAIPEEMPEYRFTSNEAVLDVLLSAGFVTSRSEGRRLIEQNGVKLDGEALTDPNGTLPHPGVLQVGKRHFLRIK